MNIINLEKRPIKWLAGLVVAALFAQMVLFIPAASAAAGGAIISAIGGPTTVESGATQEFQITVTNDASATSNISSIMVGRVHEFSIDESSIQCPFGWVPSTTSLPDSFSCNSTVSVFGPTDIDPGSAGIITFTATAPVVTEDTPTFWNMYYQDSEGGEYTGPDVQFTITESGTIPPPAATSTGAVISASVTPTTVNSGESADFDITVSNGASATASIDVIMVSETHDFSYNSLSIECPTGWTLSNSTTENFTCTAQGDDAIDIDAGQSAHITFTATAPQLEENADSSWNLYYVDSLGGEYNSPDVGFTIIGSGVPPTNTGSGAVISASVSPSIVSGGSTSQFDITVSNGASATTSVDSIIVSEVHDFNINQGSIQCPDQWILSTSTSDGFTCIYVSLDDAIGPGETQHIIFTATVPTVSDTTSTFWNMWYADTDGGEYNSPDVNFTIVPSSSTTTGTTTPPTNGGNGNGGDDSNGTTTATTSSSIITILGDNPLTIRSCEAHGFEDLGATATSTNGATTTVTTSGIDDFGLPGTYTITYIATDAEGNVVATSTRTIISTECEVVEGGGGSSRPADNAVSAGSVLGAFVGSQGFIVPGTVIGPLFLQVGQVLGAFTGQVLGALVSDLSFGDRGPEVVELQTRLTMLGYYNGPITGFFGNLTRAAVIRFQAAHGLPQTGFVGPLTRQMLNS